MLPSNSQGGLVEELLPQPAVTPVPATVKTVRKPETHSGDWLHKILVMTKKMECRQIR
jgi:hypothetical protein